MSENKHLFAPKINHKVKYFVAYSKILSLSPQSFIKIKNHFSDMEIAWHAKKFELEKTGLDDKTIDYILKTRSQINPDQELDRLDKEQVKIVTIDDNDYPKKLKQIPNPPPLLYYRGSLNNLSQTCLAVIGTRKFSNYGRQVTEELISEISKYNITIISGLALGIDGLAHQTCLEVDGQSIAVLGSGVDKLSVHPQTNRYIAEKIINTGGGLISEYPIGTTPTKYTFPMRNRIVSGLSSGILVIEAPKNSGTLITVNHGLDQNRDIYAVPGNINNKNSEGTNYLISSGAKLVTKSQDVLEELNIQMTLEDISRNKKITNDEEKIIINILSKNPIHIDKIKVSSKLNINVLSSLLTQMEIKGIIKDVGGKNYILN